MALGHRVRGDDGRDDAAGTQSCEGATVALGPAFAGTTVNIAQVMEE